MLYWVEIWYGAWKRAPLSSLFSRPTPPPPPHDYRRPYPLEPRPPAPGYTKGWWRDSSRGILATWHIYCFAPSRKCPFTVTSGVCPYQTVISGAFQFQQWTMDTYNYVSCPIIPSDLFIYLYPTATFEIYLNLYKLINSGLCPYITVVTTSDSSTLIVTCSPCSYLRVTSPYF